MGNLALKIIPNSEKNSINFSKNYRIFGTEEKVEYARSITNYKDTVTMGVNDSTLLNRYFRYSKNREVWSMWYELANGTSPDADSLSSIVFDPDEDLYVELKYEYDNGTSNALADSVVIDDVTIYISTYGPQVMLADITPNVGCSEESCLQVLVNREPSFDPYAVGDMPELVANMSYAVTLIFGIPTVYFRTTPIDGTGDYIFKEWQLFDVHEMKCVKLVLPGNKFPDNVPYFQDDGVAYEEPFEVHIDKMYYESLFGKDAEPRNKDFLYFPMVNRVYKVSGSYLKRGFMMKQVFWRLMLSKFEPNINYIMKAEETQFLDNLLLNSENTLSEVANKQTQDALMSKQYKTISERFDETRRVLNTSLSVKSLGLYYNYNMFIEYYYDQTNVDDGDDSVVYDASPTLNSDNPHLTYAALFRLSSTTADVEFLYGKDDTASPASTDGIRIYGGYDGSSILSVYLSINDTIDAVTVTDVEPDVWYGIVVQASYEFNQTSIYLYGTTMDSTDSDNITDFDLVHRRVVELDPGTPGLIEFGLESYYSLRKSGINIANARLFKTLVKEELHTHVLSNLFVKNESDLIFIDNCRPRLNAPFIVRSR